MAIRYLDPKTDIVFKRIFGTEKNKDILIHFINDIIPLKGDKRVENVTFIKPNQDIKYFYGKSSIVDVLCRDFNNNKYIVEMQVAKMDFFEERAEYYAAKAFADEVEIGEEYRKLPKVYFIGILNFNMFDKEHYKTTLKTLDVDNPTLVHRFQAFNYTFIELPKFKKKEKELVTIEDKWLFFLKKAKEISPEYLESLVKDGVIIKKAYSELNQFYWSKDEIIAYEAQKKQEMDVKAELATNYNAGLREGIEKGKEEGIKEGIEKGKEEGIKEGIEKGKEEGIKEGIEKGKEEGIKEGKEEGIKEGIEKMAKKLLEKGINKDMIFEITGIKIEQT